MQEGQIMKFWFPVELFSTLEPDETCSGSLLKFRAGTQVVIHKVKKYPNWVRVLVHTVEEPHWWGWVDDDKLVTPIEAEGEED